MSATDRLNAVLRQLAGRWDMLFAVFLLLIVGIMVVPLPPMLLDVFIACNIAITLLILMVAFYLRRALDLSTFPSIILLATIFRLALAVSTTRLILLDAHAGRIVQSFGTFVVAGNVAVGLIVFLVITIVQFVVITKGAERIAEVSARFTLDALPGKQMSIDADLRSGDISKEEARARREHLEKDSQFYGAMDGAMKFVKGDAIAGLIIIAVNLIGGMAIGMAGRGLDLATAVQTYSLLTVGDGLVSQIPALLIAISAGAVVTRVQTDDAVNIGSDISRQLTADPVALSLAGASLLVGGFLPGFPTMIFVILAAGLLGLAALIWQRRTHGEDALALAGSEASQALVRQNAAEAEAPLPEPGHDDIVAIAMTPALAARINWSALRRDVDAVRDRASRRLGLPVLPVSVARDMTGTAESWCLKVDGAVVVRAPAAAGQVVVSTDSEGLALSGIEPLGTLPMPDGRTWAFIAADAVDRLPDTADTPPLTTEAFIAMALATVIDRWAERLLGVEETAQWLSRAENDYPELVREARAVITQQKLSETLRKLLDEGIGLTSRRLILDAIIEWAPRAPEPAVLAEYLRSALRRQVSQSVADDDGVIPAIVMQDDIEEAFRAAIRRNPGATFLSLDQETGRRLEGLFRAMLTAPASAPRPPVVLCSMDVRRFVRSFLVSLNLRLPVMSFQDVAPENRLKALTALTLRQPVDA